MSDERDGEAAGLVVARRRSPAGKILDGCFLLWRILAWLGRTTYWSVFQITIPFLFWMAWSFLQTIWLMMRLSYSLLLGRSGLEDLSTSMVSSPPPEHHHYPTKSHENVSAIPWMSSSQGKTYSEDTGSTCSTSSSTRVSSLAISKPPSIAQEEKLGVASTSQTLINMTRIRTNDEDDHGSSRSRSNNIHSSPHDPENKDFDYLWESLLPAPDDNSEVGDYPTGGKEDILLDTPLLETTTRQQPTRKLIFRPKRLLSKAPPSTSTTSNHHHQAAKSSQAPQGATIETEEQKNPTARAFPPSWWSKRRDSKQKQWMTGAAHHQGGLVDGGDESLPPSAATAASKQDDPLVMQMVFFDRHKRKLAEGEN